MITPENHIVVCALDLLHKPENLLVHVANEALAVAGRANMKLKIIGFGPYEDTKNAITFKVVDSAEGTAE